MSAAPAGFLSFALSLHPEDYNNHIVRRLSALRGQYLDTAAYNALLAVEDRVMYEVYESTRPEERGELRYGLSILHPGRVGSEYAMTKGHFHTVLDTAEAYLCMQGEGYMVIETPEGESAVEELRAGHALYVRPRWAHRSVNTHPTLDLVTFFAYPAYAGHDYGTIEQKGFRKLVVAREGRPEVIDNPRWRG